MTLLRLAKNSRYVGTPLYQLSKVGQPSNIFVFGVWNRPAIAQSSADITHVVSEADLGRLDLISYTYYADALLWWVIADVNKITYPETDMYGGQKLTIPLLSNVKLALDKAASLR